MAVMCTEITCGVRHLISNAPIGRIATDKTICVPIYYGYNLISVQTMNVTIKNDIDYFI